MRVIIIGSKGFIGQHLVKYFQEKEYDVWGADVVVDYVDTERYYLIDASSSDFNTIFQSEKYDLCVNCSGAASVPDSLNNPMRDYYLNTVNVFKILSAINSFQPECKYINLGSAAVYGNPQQLPIKEDEKSNPLSPYGFHKLQAEQVCNEFYRFFKLKTCSLRIFSVYGVGLKKQLFWDLYKKAKTEKPFKLFGTGNESRDFIHVLDLVKAIDIIAENSDFKADIVNVANGEETYIKDAVSTFFGYFDYPVIYSFSGESRKGDPVNWRADVCRLSSLGYRPTVDIKTGLQKYFDWISEYNND